MKIRKGFVSNSSSSSFICEICGDSESGYDLCISETGMIRCENNHCICKSHIDKNKIIDDVEVDYDDDYDDENELSEKVCPICTMERFIPAELVIYLLKQKNITEKEIKTEIKQKFPTYKDFKTYIKQK